MKWLRFLTPTSFLFFGLSSLDIFTGPLAISPFSHSAFAAKTKPSAITIILSPEELEKLKGTSVVSDEDWNHLVGPKTKENYTVVKGDTLSSISLRLFGDAKYWPKIWQINNQTIANPHLILPGNTISFFPGSGNSLPSVSTEKNTNEDLKADASDSEDVSRSNTSSKNSGRSQEWKLLQKQSWEATLIKPSLHADPLGFDKRNKLTIPRNTGFEPTVFPATEKLTFLGQIIGSRSEAENLSINDTVYIRADEGVQVGVTYGLTQTPSLLKSPKSDRVGYSYPVLGKVKILGVRDNLFVGTIVAGKDLITRGSFLIPLPAKVPELEPIPAGSAVQGILMLDHSFSTFATSQHKEVFFDRGSEDGVKPGMIFRAYEHFDPSNNKRITNSEFIIDADIIVTQVSQFFSSGVVIKSNGIVVESATVILLTDLSDLNTSLGFREKFLDGKTAGSDDLEDLDKLDNSEGLGKDEKRELKQLERWKGNPASNDVPPPASGESTPPPPTADQTTPPPPAAEGESAPPPPPADAATNEAIPPPPPTGAEVPPPPEPTDGAQPQAASESIPPPPTDGEIPPPPPAQGSLEVPPASSNGADASVPAPPAAPSEDSSIPPPPPG